MANWTPADLTTAPVDWFKGDAGVIGAPVSQWTNQGTKSNLAQSTSGNKPTTGTLNSLPVVVFDGVNDMLQSVSNNSYAAGPYHVFIVQKRDSTGRFDNYFRAGSSWADTMGLSIQWREATDALEFFGNGYGPIYFGNSTGPAGSVYVTSEATDGLWHIMEVKFASTPAVWFDANAKALDESYEGFDVQSMTGPLLLGANNSAGEHLDGSIAEFILLSYTPTTTEQQKIQGYLAWKWGLQGNLPSGHPYKSAAPVTSAGTATLTLSLTEPVDTAAFTASSKTLAQLAVTDPSDTASFTATATTIAQLAVTDPSDTASFTATATTIADLSATETTDAVLFTLNIPQLLNELQLSTTEPSDTASFQAGLLTDTAIFQDDAFDGIVFSIDYDAQFVITEPNDTAQFTGTITTVVTFTITEAPDATDFDVAATTYASFDIAEANDTAAFNLKQGTTLILQWNVTEANDTAAFTTSATTTLLFDLLEPTDTAVFASTATTYAQFDILELNDSAAFTTFAAFFDVEDADYIYVPPENNVITLPPSPEKALAAAVGDTANVLDEFQRIDVDQTRTLRKD